MNREQIDKNMSMQLTDRVIVPLALDLGSKYLVNPYLREYDHEQKSIEYGLGYKKHGDKRHRTGVKFEAIHYRDGEKTEGATRTVEIEHRLGWSRLHDNRQAQNHEEHEQSILSYDETFNKLRTLTSVDVLTELTVSAQGEVAGFGGSVTQHSSASAHSEVETEKFNHTKSEKVIKDKVLLVYPGPITDKDGRVLEPGKIWLIERPVLKLQTTTPVMQWGRWDSAKIILNLYDWAGYRGILPRGEHKNILTFNGLDELMSFMRKELVLRFPWSEKLRLSAKSQRGLKWLANESNRNVGPVEWDRVRINEDVAALQPKAISAAEAGLN